MSRNLCATDCYFCRSDVRLVEAPRHVELRDVGPRYATEYDGLIVADAECTACGGKYLAWVDWPNGHEHWHKRDCDDFRDLSFRSTFNDEPGEADMPTRCTSLKGANDTIDALRSDAALLARIRSECGPLVEAFNQAAEASQRTMSLADWERVSAALNTRATDLSLALSTLLDPNGAK
jgi:hypothetical protein